MVRTDNKGRFSGLIPRKQDFTLPNVGWNPDDLRHISNRVTMSLLFSPIKILIVKAFVSNLQLTNQQRCTNGKRATQSNTPEGYTISTACSYNIWNRPRQSLSGNAIKYWVLPWKSCGFAPLCSPLPSQSSTKSRAVEGWVGEQGQPSTSTRAAHTAPGTNQVGSQQPPTEMHDDMQKERATFCPPCPNTHTQAAGWVVKPWRLLGLRPRQR